MFHRPKIKAASGVFGKFSMVGYLLYRHSLRAKEKSCSVKFCKAIQHFCSRLCYRLLALSYARVLVICC